ncbi:hypothetical protein [Pararhizobium haloflavum]|uniref:hypothetical protein n=1 Tax=Pararhizobium haloflavum TaxID=2037914 RepID=UPI0012FFDC8F|nr:hypothetical protein [Pararhizobium haloflavum]
MSDAAADFREAYKAAKAEFGLKGFIPARLLAISGLTLGDLARYGKIEQSGDCYAPRRTRKRERAR